MSTRLQWCLDFMKEYLKENSPKTVPFLSPVDLATYTDYSERIRRPIDFGTIKRQLEKNQYVAYEEFAADMRLVFTNCFRYNPNKHPIVESAKELKVNFELKYAKKLNSLAAVTTENDETERRRRLLERAAKIASHFNAANNVQHGAARTPSVVSAGPVNSPAVSTDVKNKRKRTKDGIQALERDIQALQEVVRSLPGIQGTFISDKLASVVVPEVTRVTKRPLNSSKDAEKNRGSKRVRGENAYTSVVDDVTPTSSNDGISSTTHTPTKDVVTDNNAFLSKIDAESDEVMEIAEQPAALPPSPARSSSLSLRDDADSKLVTKVNSSSPADVFNNVLAAPAPMVSHQKPNSLADVDSTSRTTPVITTKSPTTPAINAAAAPVIAANSADDNAENSNNGTQQQSPRKTGALDRLADTLKQKQKDSLTFGSATTAAYASGLSRLTSTGGGLANVDWNNLPMEALGVRAHIFEEHMENARSRLRQENEAREAAEQERRRQQQQQQQQPKSQQWPSAAVVGAQPAGRHLSPGWSQSQPLPGATQQANAGPYGKSSQMPIASTYTPTNGGNIGMPPAAAVMSPPMSDSSATSSTAATTSQSERLRQREIEREKRRRVTQITLDPQQGALDIFLQEVRSEGIRSGF